MVNEENDPVSGADFAVRRLPSAPTATPQPAADARPAPAPAQVAAAPDAPAPRPAPAPAPGLEPGPTAPRRGAHAGRTTHVEPSRGRQHARPESATPAVVTATQFLERQRADHGPGPARWGARGRANRLSLGTLKIPMGATEREHHAQRATIQRSLDGPRTVVVVNPKGGAAKTSAALMLGFTFGTVRGGQTVVWDNNETRGTLGVRGLEAAHRNTARELVAAQDRFADVFSARIGDLSNYVRGQGEAHFDLLASDERPEVTGQIDSEDVAALHQLLTRFYRLVVVDTGNNLRAGNWIEAVNRADVVVIPTTTDTDVSYSGLWMLDALESKGMVDPDRCVTIVRPTGDRRALETTTDAFASRTRAVCLVPSDPALAAGRRIDYARISPESRRAWLHACATISTAL